MIKKFEQQRNICTHVYNNEKIGCFSVLLGNVDVCKIIDKKTKHLSALNVGKPSKPHFCSIIVAKKCSLKDHRAIENNASKRTLNRKIITVNMQP